MAEVNAETLRDTAKADLVATTLRDACTHGGSSRRRNNWALVRSITGGERRRPRLSSRRILAPQRLWKPAVNYEAARRTSSKSAYTTAMTPMTMRPHNIARTQRGLCGWGRTLICLAEPSSQ
jgi:hypothetical protein